MTQPGETGGVTTLEVHEPQPGVLYGLEAVVHLTGASRRSVLVYCRSGLVRSRQETDAGPLAFDDEAIYSIRRIEYLRSVRGINLEGIRMIFELWAQLRRLEEEMRFLRS
jgi:DNA-binding transcriptional MerR regulator